MYSGLRLRARSRDENGSRVGERFRVSCALNLMLNSVGCTRIYLCSSCGARLMCARMIDLPGFYLQCRRITRGGGRFSGGESERGIPFC